MARPIGSKDKVTCSQKVARLGIGAVFLCLLQAALSQQRAVAASYVSPARHWDSALNGLFDSATNDKKEGSAPRRALKGFGKFSNPDFPTKK